MASRFGHIELFVQDPRSSKVFYEKIGFELIADQGDGAFIWMKLGSTEILLRKGNMRPGTKNMNESPFDLVLYTDDIFSEVEDLTKKGVDITKMENEPNCFSFRDPDGNWFQLVDLKDQQ